MRKIRSKSGFDIFVRNEHDALPGREISFSEDELAWAVRIGKDNSDPEFEKAFWEGILEKKRVRPSYSVFEDFPRETPKSLSPAAIYCTQIIEALRNPKEPE